MFLLQYGEGPAVFKSNKLSELPASRHGTVPPITAAELSRVRTAYGG